MPRTILPTERYIDLDLDWLRQPIDMLVIDKSRYFGEPRPIIVQYLKLNSEFIDKFTAQNFIRNCAVDIS